MISFILYDVVIRIDRKYLELLNTISYRYLPSSIDGILILTIVAFVDVLRSVAYTRIGGLNPQPCVQSISTRPGATGGARQNNGVEGLIGAIGNTPLIRLRRQRGHRLHHSAQPSWPRRQREGSPALGIIEDAEARGQLVPGQPGIVVEGTAGNTGIGLTLVANARGYKQSSWCPTRKAARSWTSCAWWVPTSGLKRSHQMLNLRIILLTFGINNKSS
jgi:hypothetical protein